MNIVQIDVESGCVSGPTELKTNIKSSVRELKVQILNEFSLDLSTPLYIALENVRCAPTHLKDDGALLKNEFDCSKVGIMKFNSFQIEVSKHHRPTDFLWYGS